MYANIASSKLWTISSCIGWKALSQRAQLLPRSMNTPLTIAVKLRSNTHITSD